jgi:hypothetical protein
MKSSKRGRKIIISEAVEVYFSLKNACVSQISSHNILAAERKSSSDSTGGNTAAKLAPGAQGLPSSVPSKSVPRP